MLEFRTQSLFKPQWWQSTTSDAKKFPLSLRGDTPPHPIKQGYNWSLFSATMETEGRIWFGNMIQVIARWRHSNSSWCACELITSVQRVALRLKTPTPASISVQEITTACSVKEIVSWKYYFVFSTYFTQQFWSKNREWCIFYCDFSFRCLWKWKRVRLFVLIQPVTSFICYVTTAFVVP